MYLDVAYSAPDKEINPLAEKIMKELKEDLQKSGFTVKEVNFGPETIMRRILNIGDKDVSDDMTPLTIPTGFIRRINSFLKENYLEQLSLSEKCSLLSVHALPMSEAFSLLVDFFDKVVRKRDKNFWTNGILAEILKTDDVCVIRCDNPSDLRQLNLFVVTVLFSSKTADAQCDDFDLHIKLKADDKPELLSDIRERILSAMQEDQNVQQEN